MTHGQFNIKMKRTVRRRDDRTIGLTIRTAEKLDPDRVDLYIETLLGKAQRTKTDMNADGDKEQTYLIQCKQPISSLPDRVYGKRRHLFSRSDFVRLHQAYANRSELQGRRVILKEVYESEAVQMSVEQSEPLTIERLRRLLSVRRWQRDVFACVAIFNRTTAEVELFTSDGKRE